ncbi:MAG TPA: dephospho-CoA kinase [Gammaproteobacteria bacterium]|nr:dephospho-CoA kinase [Gammaproteobacteria bacterium]
MPVTAHPPLIIGLTGGIGSGKSTAAARFAEHGVPVIDTDVIARELVAPGQPALDAIVTRFGTDLLDGEGCLRREVLRERVFADPAARQELEALLHPLIRAESLRRIAALQTAYCIWVIPLLVETGAREDLDRVLLIDCPEALQRQRAQVRDGFDTATLDGILAAQASREQRRAMADDIIVNDGTPEALRQAVDERHAAYLALAAERNVSG